MHRIEREKQTVALMIRIYCRAKHRSRDAVCPRCFELLEYAHQKLTSCPFKDGKKACSDCDVHCYSKEMRGRIQEVMRFSGPRMLLRHPIITLLHYMSSIS